MTSNHTHIRTQNSPRDQYINELFAAEDKCLKSIRQALQEDGKEGINVGPYEGKILHLLLQITKATKVVEVGLLYGYSALWMARALPSNGKLYSFEFDQQNYDRATELLQTTEQWEKMQLIHGDAKEKLRTITSEGPFDVVFIDADKNGYPEYLNWAEENVRSGGLIIGDNTFLFGHLIDQPWSHDVTDKKRQAMAEFNQRLANPEKYNAVILPTTEGLTVAQKL